MGKPSYPTREGLWAKGKRDEKGYEKVRLGMPYAEAVSQFRQAILGRDDFDPAALFVWGTMQATAVLNILKAVERAFGKEGQETVRKAINEAGYEAMHELLDNSEVSEELDEMERVSYLITALNTILYASLERPKITAPDSCEFDILWCPHQDRYTAFDCRVQRYFVEGMLDALSDHGYGDFTARVETLIPKGAEFCHFVVEKLKDHAGKNPWHKYSDELGERALKKGEEQG